MGSSKVIVELEAKDGLTPELKKSLDATQALSKELLDLNGKLAILKADKKGIIKGALESDIKGVKVLQAELKELQATYAKSKGAERVTAKKNVSDKEAQIASLLTREMVKQKRVIDEKNISRKAEIALSNKIRKGYDKERAAIEKNTGSRQKENAVRRSAGTIIIRHIRQLESLIVAYYAVSSATDILIGQGVELNKKIEDSTTGIGALISANTQGASSVQKFTASMALSSQTVRDIKKASVETAATFPQLTEAFQQAIGSALSAGQSMGATTQEAIDNTIYMAKQMTNIAASIGMPMVQLNEEIRSLMEGTADQNSRIAKMIFGSAKNANQQVREAKETAGGLNELMRGVMEPFEQLSAQRTFSRLKARMTDAFDTIKIEATKPLFEDFKDQIEKTTKYVNAHSEQWIKAYHNVYYGATDTFTALSQSAKTFSNIFATAKGDIFGVTSSLFDFQETVVGATFVIQYMGGMASNAWQMVRNVGIYFESFFKDITSSFNGFILNIKLLGKEIQLALYKALDVLPVVDNTKYIAQTEKIIEKLKIKKNINSLSHEDFLLQAEERVRENREQIKSLGQITLEAKKAGYATRQIFAVGEDSRDTFLGFSIDKSMSTSTIEKTFTAYSNAYDNLVERYKGNTKALETINTTYTRNLKVMAEDYMAIEYGKLEAKIKEVVADKVLYKKLLGFRQEYFEAMGNQEEAWKIEKEKFAAERVGLEPKMYKKLLADHKIEYLGKLTKEIKTTWDNIAQSMANSFEDNFFNFMKDGFKDIGSFAKNTFKDLGANIYTPLLQQASAVFTPLTGNVDVSTLTEQGFTFNKATGIYSGSGEMEGVTVNSAGNVLSGGDILSGISLATAGISSTITTGFASIATGLQNIGAVGATGAANIAQFGYGVANPFTVGGTGATSATMAGAYAGGGFAGSAVGYGIGSIGDSLFGADTYAGELGAIGGAIGGMVAVGTANIWNPVGWAILGASVLLGGMIGKTKQTNAGMALTGDNKFANWTENTTKSWFNKDVDDNYSTLSTAVSNQLDNMLNAFEVTLDEFQIFNNDINLTIEEWGRNFSGNLLIDLGMVTELIAGFMNKSVIDEAVVGVRKEWEGLAQVLDTSVSELILTTFASLEETTKAIEVVQMKKLGIANPQAYLSVQQALVIANSTQLKDSSFKNYAFEQGKQALLAERVSGASAEAQLKAFANAMDNVNVSFEKVTLDNFGEYSKAILSTRPSFDTIENLNKLGQSLLQLDEYASLTQNALTEYGIKIGKTTRVNEAQLNFEKLREKAVETTGIKEFTDKSASEILSGYYGIKDELSTEANTALAPVINSALEVYNLQVDTNNLEMNRLLSLKALYTYVKDLRLDKSLSPYSLNEQFSLSGSYFKNALSGYKNALANGDDVAPYANDAINYSKEYLANSKKYLRDSGTYALEFSKTTQAIEELSGYENTTLADIDEAIKNLNAGVAGASVGVIGAVNNISFKPITTTLDDNGLISSISSLVSSMSSTVSAPIETSVSSVSNIPNISPITYTQSDYAKTWDMYNEGGISSGEALLLRGQIATMSGGTDTEEYKLADNALMAYGFANGGMVNAPTLGVIGEAGYPEMVVPFKDPNNPIHTKEMLEELKAIKEESKNLKEIVKLLISLVDDTDTIKNNSAYQKREGVRVNNASECGVAV